MDTLFAMYCTVLGVMDRDRTSPHAKCVGRFMISVESIETIKTTEGTLKRYLPDVDVHRIEVDWEVGVIYCEATCPRFSARADHEEPLFYEFMFQRTIEGDVTRITSTVEERPEWAWAWPARTSDTMPPPMVEG